MSLTASSTSSLTVAKEPRSLSLPKGPFPNRIFIPPLTLLALKAVCVLISVSNLLLVLISVFFREIPWLMLLLILNSVANSSASFREIPCYSVASLSLLLLLPSV